MSSSTQWPAAVLGLHLDESNCAAHAHGKQPHGGQKAAPEGLLRPRSGAAGDAPVLARLPSWRSNARNGLQASLDVAVQAEARDTLLAQCHAMLSLEDAGDLPQDPLFDMLPLPVQAAARWRQACEPQALAAALASAALEAAALAAASRGARIAPDLSLAATSMGLAPRTCCRKRLADASAPATQPFRPGQRLQQQQQLCAASPAVACRAAAGAAATPVTLMATAKRQRLLRTAGRAGATPGSGVGSNARVAPGERAARQVARDLSFTPAPPPRQASCTGTPSTAGSVSQLTASKPLPPGHAGSAARRMVVRPFNLLRSPGTRADIDSLNDHIKASAASRVAFELHRTQPRPVDGVSPVAVAARAAARRRPFCAIRLC